MNTQKYFNLIWKAKKDFEEQFNVSLRFTGYDNEDIDKDGDGTVGMEFEFYPSDNGICKSIGFAGWLEVFLEEGNIYRVAFSCIMILPDGSKIGGGYNGSYAIFEWE